MGSTCAVPVVCLHLILLSATAGEALNSEPAVDADSRVASARATMPMPLRLPCRGEYVLCREEYVPCRGEYVLFDKMSLFHFGEGGCLGLPALPSGLEHRTGFSWLTWTGPAGKMLRPVSDVAREHNVAEEAVLRVTRATSWQQCRPAARGHRRCRGSLPSHGTSYDWTARGGARIRQGTPAAAPRAMGGR